jgi:hypothetical protein
LAFATRCFCAKNKQHSSKAIDVATAKRKIAAVRAHPQMTADEFSACDDGPDLGVSFTPDAAGQIALPDPNLLIEIISPVNQTDTWNNVWAYASIPSVREILIVQSTRIEVQRLRREADGSGPPEPETMSSDGDLGLSSIDFSAPLSDVYAKTYLAP